MKKTNSEYVPRKQKIMRESRNTNAAESLDCNQQQEQDTDKKTKPRVSNIKNEREEASLRPNNSKRVNSKEGHDTKGRSSTGT